MHKQHTQSLIAVIKQLNLEQQLLMWRVGVLAGSIIITRINPTHTHLYIQILSPRHIYTKYMHVCMHIYEHLCAFMCLCACTHVDGEANAWL